MTLAQPYLDPHTLHYRLTALNYTITRNDFTHPDQDDALARAITMLDPDGPLAAFDALLPDDLTREEATRLADALDASSIPEALATILDSIRPAPDEDDDPDDETADADHDVTLHYLDGSMTIHGARP